MEQTTYASRLRYLDADDLDDSALSFRDLDVYGTDGEKLGDLDGFLVEPTAGRVLYAVVDSGGWFTSRRFLLPVDQATVDRDARALRVNVSKGSLRGYPEFDEDRFSRFSDDEFHAYDRRLTSAWTSSTMTEGTPHRDLSTAYRHPTWWPSNGYRAERLRPIASGSFGAATGAAAASQLGDRGERHTHGTVTHTHPGGDRPHTHDRERELVTAHDRDESRGDHDDRHEAGARDRDDVSPHFGGRAQPGDVLGIETGGERTGIGDTPEEENKRRRDAERTRERE